MTKKEPYLYQKIREIWNKHTEEGTPKKIIESNMAREFRLCRDEVHRVVEEMHLENEILLRKKQRIRRVEFAAPARDREMYLEELKASR